MWSPTCSTTSTSGAFRSRAVSCSPSARRGCSTSTTATSSAVVTCRRPRSGCSRAGSLAWLLVAIPDAADRDDAGGIRRIVLDLGSEALDVHVERLRVAEVVRAPDAVDEHVACQDAARVGEEELEELELLER